MSRSKPYVQPHRSTRTAAGSESNEGKSATGWSRRFPMGPQGLNYKMSFVNIASVVGRQARHGALLLCSANNHGACLEASVLTNFSDQPDVELI